MTPFGVIRKGFGDKMAIPNMGPRPVTKVVAQPSKLNASYMLICDTQRRLALLKMLSHHPGQVANAETMFESIVRRSWVHIIRDPQLFYISQPLKVRCVYEAANPWIILHIVMYWIFEDPLIRN